jgi:hypothetical protein
MSDRSKRPAPSDADETREGGPPAMAIAVVLGALALALVGGYFFLMKLIDMGRTEDCLMSGRRDCAEIEMPVRR